MLPLPQSHLCCSLKMYNSLVERCFRDCVDSFRRKDLDSTEEKARTREHAAVGQALPPADVLLCCAVHLQVLRKVHEALGQDRPPLCRALAASRAAAGRATIALSGCFRSGGATQTGIYIS